MSTFKKAVRLSLPARIAVQGPSGSGKTTVALTIATVLAGGAVDLTPTGPQTTIADGSVAGIDTENGSMALYGDQFNFDVMDFTAPYNPHTLVANLLDAKSAGYKAVIVDSLSHFWNGEGGVLDIVEDAASRSKGNKFAGWKDGTPAQNRMLDTIRGLGIHAIVTMRSKTEYVQDGKQIIKVGTAPIQRDGAEYEFDVVLDVDLQHNVHVIKSRCPLLSDRKFRKEQVTELATTLRDWLNSGTVVPMASEEDKQNIRDLAVQVNFDETKIRQGLSWYAKANSWEELTAEGAGAMIGKLREHLLALQAQPATESESATETDAAESTSDSAASGPFPTLAEAAAAGAENPF